MKETVVRGLPSYCTGNILVIQSLMRLYKGYADRKLLIEATANQVNQFGGYTGKTPLDFKNDVLREAKKLDFKESRLIFGGDHLGPLVWRDLDSHIAMDRAADLIQEFAKAGYQKIHLDTSMQLGEERGKSLSTKTIAERGLRLYKICEEERNSFKERIYVIGSEVPIPGGETYCDSLTVTAPKDAEQTIDIYKKVFYDGGVSIDEFEKKICALVVQPGVEFTKNQVFYYKSDEAKHLMGIRKGSLVFEGHSTDYQTEMSLKTMVRDGVKILKVGPELTFMLRVALERLESIEKHIVDEKDRSNFSQVLLDEMRINNQYWEKYYSNDCLADFACSYLDRSRYYLMNNRVSKSIETLKRNVDGIRNQAAILKIIPELGICEKRLFDNVIDYHIGLVVRKYENAFSE